MTETSYRRTSRKSHEGMDSHSQARSWRRDRVLAPAAGGPDTRALHRWSRCRKTGPSKIVRDRSAEERRTTSSGSASARPQFGEHGLEDRRLRRHEALQIRAIRRCHLSSPFQRAAPHHTIGWLRRKFEPGGACSLVFSRARKSRSTLAEVRRFAKITRKGLSPDGRDSEAARGEVEIWAGRPPACTARPRDGASGARRAAPGAQVLEGRAGCAWIAINAKRLSSAVKIR
jgi:hypothetical protein